ncbi:MAG: HlyD family type I secretion periplasmic adaptor subunit [Pseudomonadota bacterium]
MASFLTWASFTEIEEVARGDGRVIPAGRTQSIQATEPGVVTEIAVQIGQVVDKGQLVVRLDDTATQSDLGEVEARSRALEARIARLELEERGEFDADFICPPNVRERAPEICENERQLLTLDRTNYENSLSVLRQRVIQRERELEETRANINRLEGAFEISQREFELIKPLAAERLVAQTELIRVEREVNNHRGKLAVSREAVPRLQGAIEEARLQMRELTLQFRRDALTRKTEALAELSVLRETARGETSRVARTDITTPVDGVINTMQVNTIGAFVRPGDVIAEVVPTSEELLIEARISPNDVAFVLPGQLARVKITAFDFSVYGALDGEVITIGSDSILDEKTGEPYFEARIRTKTAYLERGGERFQITPGMISTADILTGKKTVLSYLLKPLNKVQQEALSER